jgi:hypothetical protein
MCAGEHDRGVRHVVVGEGEEVGTDDEGCEGRGWVLQPCIFEDESYSEMSEKSLNTKKCSSLRRTRAKLTSDAVSCLRRSVQVARGSSKELTPNSKQYPHLPEM